MAEVALNLFQVHGGTVWLDAIVDDSAPLVMIAIRLGNATGRPFKVLVRAAGRTQHITLAPYKSEFERPINPPVHLDVALLSLTG